MSDPLVGALAGAVGADHVLTEADVTAAFTTDWTGRWRGECRAVVRPATTDQVAAAVRACREHRVPVVPQGGNTGLVGGSVPRGGEVVVSLTRLDRLDAVDSEGAQVTAGAGVTIGVLQQHAAEAGLRYGVDLASRDTATVGGTIATNAGGINVVRHGATRSQVIGVEAVLPDGRVLRRLHGLTKDSTGYDLPGLLTGSEGTLGIVTAARLRLHPAAPHRVVALLGVPSTAVALDVLAAVRPLPSLMAVEWFHRLGLELTCEHTGLTAPFDQRHRTYVLVECAAATDPAAALAAAIDGVNDVGDVAVATDRPDRERLWAYRERHTEGMAAAHVGLKYDVAVPPRRLPDFERGVEALCRHHGARIVMFGHLAEGNVHANVLDAPSEPSRLDEGILGLVAANGGSISAEHGVGVLKVPWLHLTRDEADRDAMRAIKRALDPDELFNPGVLFPSEGAP